MCKYCGDKDHKVDIGEKLVDNMVESRNNAKAESPFHKKKEY